MPDTNLPPSGKTAMLNSFTLFYTLWLYAFAHTAAIACLPPAGWFGNTAPDANLTPSGKPWRTATMALLPVVIVFGPVEGLAAALEMYVGREANREMLGYRLREASTAVSGRCDWWWTWRERDSW